MEEAKSTERRCGYVGVFLFLHPDVMAALADSFRFERLKMGRKSCKREVAELVLPGLRCFGGGS